MSRTTALPARLHNRFEFRTPRGQTLVEFALVLPMLLVLLLGIADFGRVFAAGITLEAAARNAAEIVAEEYRRTPPDGEYADQTQPVSSFTVADTNAYYTGLHELAAAAACRETRSLEHSTADPDTGACAPDAVTGEYMPLVLVCIHDGADPLCSTPPAGMTIDSHCSALLAAPTNAMQGATEQSRYVEVRLCYRFSMLVHTALLPLGDVWLQKDRVFTVAYFPPPPTPTPPPPAEQPTSTELPSDSPTPSESPSPTPSESASESPSPTSEATATPEPTAVPTPEPTPTPAPTPTAPSLTTPTPTPTGTTEPGA